VIAARGGDRGARRLTELPGRADLRVDQPRRVAQPGVNVACGGEERREQRGRAVPGEVVVAVVDGGIAGLDVVAVAAGCAEGARRRPARDQRHDGDERAGSATLQATTMPPSQFAYQ
jgi:hypothetical protein